MLISKFHKSYQKNHVSSVGKEETVLKTPELRPGSQARVHNIPIRKWDADKGNAVSILE